jgi:hypothetical protein
MAATLVARGLTAGHGDRVLFADLDLVVAPGDYTGTLLFVTHDRRLLAAVHTNRRIDVRAGRVVELSAASRDRG